MPDINMFQKRSVHGMFIFIVFAVIATSTVLMVYIQVSADIDDMQDTSVFVMRRNYLREQLGK